MKQPSVNLKVFIFAKKTENVYNCGELKTQLQPKHMFKQKLLSDVLPVHEERDFGLRSIFGMT